MTQTPLSHLKLVLTCARCLPLMDPFLSRNLSHVVVLLYELMCINALFTVLNLSYLAHESNGWLADCKIFDNQLGFCSMTNWPLQRKCLQKMSCDCLHMCVATCMNASFHPCCHVPLLLPLPLTTFQFPKITISSNLSPAPPTNWIAANVEDISLTDFRIFCLFMIIF